jgi:hypothetical protein
MTEVRRNNREQKKAERKSRRGKESGYNRMVERNQQKKADKISELEGRLESGNFRPRQPRSKVQAQLEELQAAPKSRRSTSADDKGDSFAQAVEDAVSADAVAATPPPQRDRSGSGERIRRGQMEAAEREKPLIIDDYADEPLIIDDYADEKGYEESLKDADAGFEEAFGEDIGGYESRMEAMQEADEKADALFKEPTLRAEPVPEMDEKESGRLFKMIMGGSFDSESPMDKGKMDILKKAKAENPDLSDNQLALKIYRDYM